MATDLRFGVHRLKGCGRMNPLWEPRVDSAVSLCMDRRLFLAGLLGLPLAASFVPGPATARVNSADLKRLQQEWTALLPVGFRPPDPEDKVELSDRQWQQRLTEAAFVVLREEGTERPFTSALNDEKRPGLYACAGCDLPLFSSAMKYDSGTGWPSFFTHIPGSMGTKRDFVLFYPRTEYHCIRCGGHQGHVFNDGPEPTRERWCNNGVALKFLSSESSVS